MLLLAGALGAAPARADDATLQICGALTDSVAALIRSGRMAQARRATPQLQRCRQLQQQARDRDARRILQMRE
ncbi:MAG: hypothetical protein H7312_05360 [Tardiphaga sp.]|nr:hypothetical protein [Tardiphaga sp.]